MTSLTSKRMRFTVTILLGLALIATLYLALRPTRPSASLHQLPGATVTVGQATFTVEVADTAEEQVRGLGGVTNLKPDQGMYFPQTKQFNPSFWMKDMLIPIDILWIKHGRVIGIDANIQPPSPADNLNALPRYQSPEDFPDAVLEIAANRSQELGISVGDRVIFQP